MVTAPPSATDRLIYIRMVSKALRLNMHIYQYRTPAFTMVTATPFGYRHIDIRADGIKSSPTSTKRASLEKRLGGTLFLILCWACQAGMCHKEYMMPTRLQGCPFACTQITPCWFHVCWITRDCAAVLSPDHCSHPLRGPEFSAL